MKTKHIIYISKAVAPFEKSELLDLEHQAQIKNRKLGITGMLCYVQSQFIQYLEGSAESVDYLMESISMDQRHTIIKRIQMSGIGNRLFEDWSLRYYAPDDLEAIFPNFLGFVLEYGGMATVLDTDMESLLVNNLRFIAAQAQ